MMKSIATTILAQSMMPPKSSYPGLSALLPTTLYYPVLVFEKFTGRKTTIMNELEINKILANSLCCILGKTHSIWILEWNAN